MSVVNVQKRELRRSGYRSLKDWVDDPDNVYIGRKTSGAPDNYDFKWGNPFPEYKYGREECIKMFKKHLYSSGLIDDIEELRGKNLGCWCSPKACHGDVLMKVLRDTEKTIDADNDKQSENTNTIFNDDDFPPLS